jgi:ectoine hydroxylase-related dioxygenase (phytanoyl-CoA dioxygenase family)
LNQPTPAAKPMDKDAQDATLTLSAEDMQASVPSSELIEQAAEIYDRKGFLVLENIFDPELLTSLRADYLAKYVEQGHDHLARSNATVGDKRLMVTVDVEGAYNDPRIYANPMVMAVMHKLLEDGFVLNGYGSVVAFPGSKLQTPHRDYQYLFTDKMQMAAELPPYAITLFIPLVDLDGDVGTTLVSDGSHRDCSIWMHNVVQHPISFPYPQLGSCYMIDYRTFHAGTPNNSDRPRPVLFLTYSRPWFRDPANYDMQDAVRVTDEAYTQIPENCRDMFRLVPAAMRAAHAAKDLT